MNKKYAIVSGAASGIGKSVSEKLLSKDIIVFALDILECSINGAICLKCDVSSEEDLKRTSLKISEITNRIDYMVLPAGILCQEKRYFLEDLPLDEWQAVINTNLTSVMLMIQAFIPLIKNSKCGSVVTYSSEQVVRPIPKSGPYLVSKVALESLTKLAALEYLSSKIRFNCIRTATVDTNFLSSLVKEPEIRKSMRDDMDLKMPLGIITPREIAELTWNLLDDNACKITGQVITIDSGVLL